MYPDSDKEFRELTIKSVGDDSVTFDDGWSIGTPKSFTEKIEPGMSARQYGKGVGYTVRGLFIDGKQVWYRNEAEEKVHQHDQTYGASAQEILERWDAGRSVFSIEMGGFGPGYEQCIQITAFEVLRICLDRKYKHENWANDSIWRADKEDMEGRLKLIDGWDVLGLSGAQYGAAMNLGLRIYRFGPQAISEADEMRSIQVSKGFPVMQTE